MPAKKLLQVIPQSIVFTSTRAGATAVTITDFSDPVLLNISETYSDIASQSSEYAIGQLLTGKAASMKTTLNNFDLQQLNGLTSSPTADYTVATDTQLFKAGSWTINTGMVVFSGLDTTVSKIFTVTFAAAVVSVSGDISFGKGQEARIGIHIQAVRGASPTATVYTLAYAV